MGEKGDGVEKGGGNKGINQKENGRKGRKNKKGGGRSQSGFTPRTGVEKGYLLREIAKLDGKKNYLDNNCQDIIAGDLTNGLVLPEST